MTMIEDDDEIERPPSRKKVLLVAMLLIVVLGSAGGGIWWWLGRPKPFGIESRVAWTSSRILGSPEPADPYLTRRVFPQLTFAKPVDIAFAPEGNRIFIAQQEGKIFSFLNDASASKADLLLDMTRLNGLKQIPNYVGINVTSIALHPRFKENHYLYVCCAIAFPPKRATEYARLYPENKDAARVSRFTVNSADPPTIDPRSEKLIVTWPGGGNSAGCVRFGLDSNLYISTGDGGDASPPDPFNVGQDVNDLRGKILRIDVDHPAGNLPYSIPVGNPLVNVPRSRGEMFAYGLRNPWRMSIDRISGEVWTADIGWELWDSVYRVVNGGNYGWSITEGPQTLHASADTHGILPPDASISHREAAAITGGFVYHGKKLPELQNQYIFGDRDTRRLWAAPCDGKKLAAYRAIAQTEQRIVSFSEDDDGEPCIVDYEGGGLWQIAANPQAGSIPDFPRILSETGLFSDLTEQKPNPGVLPFHVNAPQWVDGSTSEHFIAVPGNEPVIDRDDSNRVYPANTVLARTLSLITLVGDAQARRKIETQLLHYDGRRWHGYAYQWNPEQTDALLVDANGLDVPLTIVDSAAPGGKRQQVWRFNSRAQCMSCHTASTHYTLAFNEPQLDSIEAYQTVAHGPISDNQLRSFRHIGLVPMPPEASRENPARSSSAASVLVNPYEEDASHSLDDRARSYLHVNCAMCHRKGGGASTLFDVRKEMTLNETRLISEPLLGAFDLPNGQIIWPGDPTRSVLYYRLAMGGAARMPHLGSMVIDDKGVDLIGKWIVSLRGTPGAPHLSEPEMHDQASQYATLLLLQSGTAGPAAVAALDKLLASTDGAIRLLVALEDGRVPAALRPLAAQRAMAALQESVRDLYSRFAPQTANAPAAVVGAHPDVKRLLATPGDVERGRKVFFEFADGLCSKCHVVSREGFELGPDLTHIGSRYNRAEMLESILNPSKTIAAGYETYAVRTKSGATHVGFMISKSNSEVVMKDLQRNVIRLNAEEIENSILQTVSAMPEGLIAGLQLQQAADLLEYLVSRK